VRVKRFAPGTTRWRDEGILTQLDYDLTDLARVKEGRKPEPTDAAKKIVGRKRGILTDTIGLIRAVTATAASLSENAVGIQLLDQAKKTYLTNPSTASAPPISAPAGAPVAAGAPVPSPPRPARSSTGSPKPAAHSSTPPRITRPANPSSCSASSWAPTGTTSC
jgi:hypothetical protein